MPQTQKELLWITLKKHFGYPPDDEEKLKDWVLKKMTTQFQTFKKNMWRDYGKKGKTPSFKKYPKLQHHWSEFVQYKLSETGAKVSARNTSNSHKNIYPHKLRPSGYKKAIPKWLEMEEMLLAKGITPATANWPARSKQWFYAHGGTLDPTNGTAIYADNSSCTSITCVDG